MVVLVVDDDAVSRLVIEHILQGGKFATIAVASAAEAAAVVHDPRRGIDLIVCDYLMPDATGLDLLQQLRDQDSVAVPPFVLLTGISEADDLNDPRVQYLSGYLTKPVKSSELLALAETITQPAKN